MIGVPLTEEMQLNLPQGDGPGHWGYETLEPEAARLARNYSQI